MTDKPRTLKIDDVEYVRSDQAPKTGNRVIVKCLNANDFTGILRESAPGAMSITLDNAATIRKWGTTKGLGELSKNGPTANTVLDGYAGTLELQRQNIIAIAACTENWK